MIKLVVIGHLAINKTTTPRGTGIYCGGAGYHVAWSAAINLPKGSVGLVSRCGKDFDLKFLTKAGVDIKGVIVDKNIKSDVFYIEENKKGRIFRAEGKMRESLTLENVPKNYLEASFLHLATATPDQQIGWYRQAKKIFKNHTSISSDSFELFINENQEAVQKVFELSDMIFVNQEEWQKVDRKKLKETPVILKRGKEGASYLYGDKEIFQVKAPVVKEVTDTTGAGEVVAGVFLSLKSLGYNDEYSLTKACEIASVSVENFGIEHIRNNYRYLKKI